MEQNNVINAIDKKNLSSLNISFLLGKRPSTLDTHRFQHSSMAACGHPSQIVLKPGGRIAMIRLANSVLLSAVGAECL
jgi:hypothetical protein